MRNLCKDCLIVLQLVVLFESVTNVFDILIAMDTASF